MVKQQRHLISVWMTNKPARLWPIAWPMAWSMAPPNILLVEYSFPRQRSVCPVTDHLLQPGGGRINELEMEQHLRSVTIAMEPPDRLLPLLLLLLLIQLNGPPFSLELATHKR